MESGETAEAEQGSSSDDAEEKALEPVGSSDEADKRDAEPQSPPKRKYPSQQRHPLRHLHITGESDG